MHQTQLKIQFFVSCLCVFIITVGGQKYFGYFFHATEEERELWLVGGEKKHTTNIRLINRV